MDDGQINGLQYARAIHTLSGLTVILMRQFLTIAANAFMELVRQPVFLLLTTSSVIFEIFLATPYYFAFGDEPKLVKNSTLALMLLVGLFGAVLSASASLAREIRLGTALAVLAKPVGRAQFLLAKYVGLMIALAVLTYVNLVGALLASRMAFDAYGSTDLFAWKIFAASVLMAYLAGGFANYFLRRPFVSDAVFSLVVMVTVGFVVINFFNKEGAPQAFATGVDWRLIPAAVLILFALWILAGVALACSTRLDTIPTLAICSAVFLLGLMSDYLFGRRADLTSWWTPIVPLGVLTAVAIACLSRLDTIPTLAICLGVFLLALVVSLVFGWAAGMGSWLASVLYTVTPNWQLFWLADALDTDQATLHWGYVAKAFAYMVGYVGAALTVAVLLFEERELS